jgi:hypothetical protein
VTTEAVRDDDDGTHGGLYLACDVCPARMGQACYSLSSGGPESLPARRLSVPHGSRKLSGAKTGTPKPAKPATGRSAGPVARRAKARTDSTADAWRALAAKKGST